MLPSSFNPASLPSFPAIGSTPYGTFGATNLSSILGGKGMTTTRGASYLNPNDRSFALTVDIEWFNLPTLDERLHDHMVRALIFHLADTAQSVIAMAQQSLTPGHGYDTGKMRNSLIYALADHLLATGVYYDLFSEEAYYWRWVEFGHWIAGTNSFWPGYHFLENALMAHESRIRTAVREAWADTVIRLGAEARASL